MREVEQLLKEWEKRKTGAKGLPSRLPSRSLPDVFEAGMDDGPHVVVGQGVEDILSFPSSLDQVGQP